MKVLVVGSGGREHALCWKLAGSPQVREVLAAPGNPGMAAVARCVGVAVSDVPGLVALAEREGVGLVVVGPEAPLVAGLADALRDAGVPVFGPSAAAAALEGSKVFAKERMAEAGIPTAAFRVFDDADAAEAYVRAEARPLVVKADGLAAGKGVVVAADADEAAEAIDAMMRRRVFGEAGARVVIEEQLRGPELSYHVITDGTRYVPLAMAQDHKRLGDGDQGPNTGGMGAYSPPPFAGDALEREVLERVVEPILAVMRERGTPLTGALFVGLMLVDGAPMVLEFNVRMGDPETEALMARLAGDALPLFLGAAEGDLSGVTASWDAPASLAVVLAAEGYPAAPKKGARITGLVDAAALPGVQVFHAGTSGEGEALAVAGGRVLVVTGVGGDVDEAAERAYAGVAAVRFEGRQVRRDIGWQARRSG